MAQTTRIQKALSDAGIVSRRKAEQLVAEGKVTVNGRPAKVGHPINIKNDVVAIDGVRVDFPRKKENIYIMVNKPRGYVTTTNDELGRRDVTQLVSNIKERLYPVGRLDKNTEGLLLMTNDGAFANLIMHPRNHISKTYRVTVHPDISDEQAVQLATGVNIGEGETTMPAIVHVLEKQAGRVVLQMTISEGKNRQIRRMCEAVGLEVGRLKRISVGPLKLGMIQPGKYRELKKSEVIALRNASKPAGKQEAVPSDEKRKSAGSFGKGVRKGTRRKDGFVGQRSKDDDFTNSRKQGATGRSPRTSSPRPTSSRSSGTRSSYSAPKK